MAGKNIKTSYQCFTVKLEKYIEQSHTASFWVWYCSIFSLITWVTEESIFMDDSSVGEATMIEYSLETENNLGKLAE